VLLTGVNETLDVQVGDANTTNERFTIELSDLTASTLGVDTAAVDLSTASGAQAAVDVFDTALDTVASADSELDAASLALGVLLDHVERQAE
jgi:hypothetical protein